MYIKRGFAALALALAAALAACGQPVQPAQTPAEPTQAESEQAAAPEQGEQAAAPAEEDDIDRFSAWNEDAPALAALREYVEDVTDPASPNFIPVEERIVVSDFDGTLFGELNPTYFDWAMSVHRVKYDSTYTATPEQLAIAEEIEETERTGVSQPDGMDKQAHMAAEAYGGMTPGELWDYAVAFGQEPAPGFTGMNRDEAYYVPMLQVVDYLIENDFTFYVVTGTDRTIARAVVDGMIDIPPSQVIGSDNTLVATGQGDTDGLDYTWDGKGDDVLVFGGEFVIKDLKMNKVSAIWREIGAQPVVTLGNSSSDYAMMNYVINDNPHRTLALFVLADDTVRERGNAEKAEKLRGECAELGYVPISTRDDWNTIYGPDVELDETWTWDAPDATGPNAIEAAQDEAA